MNDSKILALQVAGFVGALAILPFMRGLPQILFSVAFAVHFVGDAFRAYTDGVIQKVFKL